MSGSRYRRKQPCRVCTPFFYRAAKLTAAVRRDSNASQQQPSLQLQQPPPPQIPASSVASSVAKPARPSAARSATGAAALAGGVVPGASEPPAATAFGAPSKAAAAASRLAWLEAELGPALMAFDYVAPPAAPPALAPAVSAARRAVNGGVSSGSGPGSSEGPGRGWRSASVSSSSSAMAQLSDDETDPEGTRTLLTPGRANLRSAGSCRAGRHPWPGRAGMCASRLRMAPVYTPFTSGGRGGAAKAAVEAVAPAAGIRSPYLPFFLPWGACLRALRRSSCSEEEQASSCARGYARGRR